MSNPDGSQALVLVVDDEPSICWGFERMLQQEGHRVVTASSAEEGLRIAAEQRPALVVLDVRLPGEDGLSALPRFLEVTHQAPVIVMTAFGDLQTAVGAVQRGATDYLTKPFQLDTALQACRSAIQLSQNAALNAAQNNAQVDANRAARPPRGERLVGKSPAMQQAFRLIAMVADSDLSVLITGETGTGKELVAAAVHQHSTRRAGPYLPVAPVTFSAELLESELFGHARGAYTGAVQDRAGVFEMAKGGTLFLDEIGDLPIPTQIKLLRVLETGQYSRVGEATPRQSDVRILAATNSDLGVAVAEGRFRKDLFYRLNSVHIHLPPLRERIEDIELLAHHFLRESGREDAETAMDASFIEQLCQRPWHGNVRELRNAIERAAVLARGRPLSVADIPPPEQHHAPTTVGALDQAVAAWCQQALQRFADENGAKGGVHEELLRQVEPILFRIALEHTGGNRARAADLLGMHRGTLRERLRSYDLEN
ncbi:MAG: sigma-54-dependent Fis family transcriptional regulator [Planctomycetales bacterium]|nr:sigma-54-dependent Fis family transcriptional regulator [Planctomycetales bacterium]